MNKVTSSAVVVAGLVVTLSGAVSWGQVPDTNDKSDIFGNTGGGSGALRIAELFFGRHNTAYGQDALLSNTDGHHNTAIGARALIFNRDGAFNTASGTEALAHNITGWYNTASGVEALANSTTGSFNTAVGRAAFFRLVQGSDNIALGSSAGYHLESEDYNIYLGHSGVTAESNTMRLGHDAVTDNGITTGIARTFIAGISGVPVHGSAVVVDGNGQLGILASSARYKRDIQAMGERSQGLYHLRPVTFRYKQDTPGPRQYGLIAEEVAKVYPELVTKGADGKVESVQYHELIPMLLNEVQHQQQKLDVQAQELAELKAQNEEQRALNAALAARLERLEQGATRTATAATR